MAALITEAAISSIFEGVSDAVEIHKLEKNIKKIKTSYKNKLNYKQAE